MEVKRKRLRVVQLIWGDPEGHRRVVWALLSIYRNPQLDNPALSVGLARSQLIIRQLTVLAHNKDTHEPAAATQYDDDGLGRPRAGLESRSPARAAGTRARNSTHLCLFCIVSNHQEVVVTSHR